MSLSDKTRKYIKNNCNKSLKGRRVLITGANSGIGYKTAETLIYQGASVIMACRNLTKAESARKQLLADYPQAEISIMELDMADFSSIDRFARKLPELDVFINNAGIFHHPGERTKDGFELVMGTNYLGVYYLGRKVLPKLRKCGHDVVYINTISIIHKIAKVDFDHFYDDRNSYSRSKLCLTRYTEYLARKCAGSNIHVYMTHPGIAITSIAEHIFKKAYVLAKIMPFNSVETSSLSALWILTHQVEEGSVVGPNGFICGWGYPQVNRKCKRAGRGIKKLIKFTEKEIRKKGNFFATSERQKGI